MFLRPIEGQIIRTAIIPRGKIFSVFSELYEPARLSIVTRVPRAVVWFAAEAGDGLFCKWPGRILELQSADFWGLFFGNNATVT
jgi:hypothetical protein